VHHVHHLIDTVAAALRMTVVALFVVAFLLQPFRIPSESMERTLLVGDFLLVDKASFAPAGAWGWLLPYQRVRRGDIVVFHFPLDSEEHVVKRVIGTPGDRIALRNGVAVVNNDPRPEPWDVFERADRDEFRDQFPRFSTDDPSVDPGWRREMRALVDNARLRVLSHTYFVLGDNRNHSRDSRYWGFVPQQNIEGTPLLIYFSVREPSRTDAASFSGMQIAGGQSGHMLDFARWDRILHVIH
jgi:signal peptidase I